MGSVKDSLSLIVPVVTLPEQVVVTVGSPASIEANVKSCPSPDKVVWQKSMESNPESFQNIDIYDSKYLGSNGDPADPKLVISSNSNDDGQYYRLLVFNGIAKSTSNITHLNVESEYKYLENKDFRERFLKYLEEGSIKVCPISQIIIVGEHGVGKTTLLYRLQGRSQEEIKAIKSTRGVECHTEHHSFIITKNQLKMNLKGVSSLSVDPGHFNTLLEGIKNNTS
ncbi:uncharacterized protein LOC134275169 [Saccostrea cucullata]|uniref:uncharacterized protein LOC134275169 n=1 Tax=Saccostrea cuccullata TaxID=36930 RepID=UPI002ED18050